MKRKILSSILIIAVFACLANVVYLLAQPPAIPANTLNNLGLNEPYVISVGGYAVGANEIITAARAATFITIDTGQGANEVYSMDQDVESTDDVVFNSIDANEYFLSGVNKTDILKYPYLGYSYQIGIIPNTSPILYYAKNGTTGAIDYVNASASGVIQSAHDALPSSGGLIHLSVGSFLFTENVNISKNDVTIDGCGDGEVGEAATRVYATTAIRLFLVTAGRNVCFKNFLIQGSAYNNAQYGIYVLASKRIRIEGMTFYHNGYGIYLSGETWTPKITSCHFYENNIGSYIQATDPQVIGSDYKLNYVIACHFIGQYDIFFTGNEIVGESGRNTDCGLKIENVDRGTVIGNSIRECAGDGIKLTGTSNEIKIVGNTIRHNTENGIELLSTVTRCIINDNTISDNHGLGLNIAAGPTNNQVEWNRFYNNDGGTITNLGTGTVLQGNEGDVGIYQTGDYGALWANWVAGIVGTPGNGTSCVFYNTNTTSSRYGCYSAGAWGSVDIS